MMSGSDDLMIDVSSSFVLQYPDVPGGDVFSPRWSRSLLLGAFRGRCRD